MVLSEMEMQPGWCEKSAEGDADGERMVRTA